MSDTTKPQLTSTTYEFPIRGPEKKKTIGELIYDGENGRILGRTPKNWVQLIVFYSIFYTVLAALFTICLQGLFFTINDDYPKWQLDESLIGTNPGLGFRPLPENVEEGSLIWYDAKNASQIEAWTSRLDTFFNIYRNRTLLPGGGKNQIICDFDTLPQEGEVCAVEVDSWHPCAPSDGYGYSKGKPCVFLKLNRIYNWKPEFYTQEGEFPQDMPEELKQFILSLPMEKRQQIWVSCDGQDAVDNESIDGGFEYYPKNFHGFPGYYYPYTNNPGYLSPLVAVRLMIKPNVHHQIINIECKAWAKNIIVQGGRDRLGSVHFEVMID